MSKGLEALKEIREALGTVLETRCEIIEKELKALEIIKKKEVNVAWFTYVDNLEDYNKGKFIGSYLTQEEYDFLKEVLL